MVTISFQTIKIYTDAERVSFLCSRRVSLFPPQLFIQLTLCWPPSKPNPGTEISEGSLFVSVWFTLRLAT